MKIIKLSQRNLNRLEMCEEFIYSTNKLYKKGQIVCSLEGNKIMIPLSTLCSVDAGIETAKKFF